MLRFLSSRISARPRRTLLLTLAFVLVSAVLGGPVFGLLKTNDAFTPANSEGTVALHRLEGASGLKATPGVILLVRPGGAVRAPAAQARVAGLARELRAVPGVAKVVASSGPGFVSADGRSTYVLGTLRASADQADVAKAVTDRFDGRRGVTLGGDAIIQSQLGATTSADLGKAELLAFPLLILLTLLFFRGGRAALIPLAVGITTILGTFLVLRGVNEVKGLSVFSINLVIGLGLGLAIDYSLFLLTRYREEVERSGPGPQAVRATMLSAGRTVLLSAATVAIALATLTVFPLNFLQSMGIGGAAVAIVAALAALVVAPAFFALWGARLIPRTRKDAADGRWYRIAHLVMRRPGAVAAITAVAMAALALPALRAQWTSVDRTSIPSQLSSRTVADALERDFPRQDSSPIPIEIDADAGQAGAVARWAAGLRTVPGVQAVAPARALDDATWQVDVRAAVGDAAGVPAQRLVQTLRDRPAPFPARVGGAAADFLDQQEGIADALPLAIALLVVLTFLVLWVMTGSVVLPVKSLVMNALTVGATLGVLTLVFQDGRLEGLLGYTANGGIEPTDFLVTAALVFALSTDYGVFLLGRIKEARDSGLTDREAVATGLGRTGSVVTAAAILLAVAIGAFVTSSVSFIQQIGVGAAVGVLLDAFVVRGLLVPSLMALLGRWNWWSPASLRRFHARIGSAETGRAGAAAYEPT